MKRILSILFCTVMFSGGNFLLSQNPVITTVGSYTGEPGLIYVPVSVENFTDIGSFTLTFRYNSAVLTYSHYIGNPTLINGNGYVYVLSGPQTRLQSTWFTPFPITLPAGALIGTLVFNAVAGASELAWELDIPSYCVYKDINQNLLPASYVNGSVLCGFLPSCATNPYPVDEDCFSGGLMSWQAAGATPTSFNVYFGPENPPVSNVVNVQGTTFQPPANLVAGTRYYWQVVPVNEIGPAPGCPVWSFFYPYPVNHPPVVSNVRVEQLPDCEYYVDIYYDVSDEDGDALRISLKMSNTLGLSWDFEFYPEMLIGDIGNNIAPGPNKHVRYFYYLGHVTSPPCASFMVKVIADDLVYYPMGTPCPGECIVDYGGKRYHPIRIGNQCWLKENLDIGVMVTDHATGFNHVHTSDNGIIEKYCYNNDPVNCEIYGGLYDWNEMMQYDNGPGVRGICPEGWHIPTSQEWCTLSTFLDPQTNCLYAGTQSFLSGSYLKETSQNHWSPPHIATNHSKFTARGAGKRIGTGGFANLKDEAWFLVSETVNAPDTHTDAWGLAYFYNGLEKTVLFSRNEAASVRCIKNGY